MPKYAVGLAWTDADRTELVADTDERARFMAYGPGIDVPDDDAKKCKLRATGEDKQRAVSEDKAACPGLHVDPETPKPHPMVRHSPVRSKS